MRAPGSRTASARPTGRRCRSASASGSCAVAARRTPYIPLLTTIPGIAWVLGYTIAAEIGDIARFASPRKLIGYTGRPRKWG